MSDLLTTFSNWFRPHLTFIASAYIATILVIYGERINKAVWMLVRGMHFIVRTLVFVGLCAVGYGTISVYLVPVIRDVLLLAGALWLGPLVILSFLFVGWLAEHHSRKG